MCRKTDCHISPSALEDLRACPFRSYLKRVQKIFPREDESEAILKGKALHVAVANLLSEQGIASAELESTKPLPSNLGPSAALRAIEAIRWDILGCEDIRGRLAPDNRFWLSILPRNATEVGVNHWRPFPRHPDFLPICLSIDLLIPVLVAGQLEALIVDWKFGSKPPEENRFLPATPKALSEDIAMRCYALAVWDAVKLPITIAHVACDFAGSCPARVIRYRFSFKELEQAREELRDLLADEVKWLYKGKYNTCPASSNPGLDRVCREYNRDCPGKEICMLSHRGVTSFGSPLPPHYRKSR